MRDTAPNLASRGRGGPGDGTALLKLSHAACRSHNKMGAAAKASAPAGSRPTVQRIGSSVSGLGQDLRYLEGHLISAALVQSWDLHFSAKRRLAPTRPPVTIRSPRAKPSPRECELMALGRPATTARASPAAYVDEGVLVDPSAKRGFTDGPAETMVQVARSSKRRKLPNQGTNLRVQGLRELEG